MKQEDLSRAVELADLKLRQASSDIDTQVILLLLDADDDAACTMGPRLAEIGKGSTKFTFACALAVVEYETWFVAAAQSLNMYLALDNVQIPDDPESARAGKGWIERHFQTRTYSETVDQPRMTASFDLAMCRARSRSFDKLCRELEKQIPPSAG